jgi:hypothetical protein
MFAEDKLYRAPNNSVHLQRKLQKWLHGCWKGVARYVWNMCCVKTVRWLMYSPLLVLLLNILLLQLLLLLVLNCSDFYKTYGDAMNAYIPAVWHLFNSWYFLCFCCNQHLTLMTTVLACCVVQPRLNCKGFECAYSFHRQGSPGDRGSKHLWNVGQYLLECTAQHSWRQSSSYSPPWEPEVSQPLTIFDKIFDSCTASEFCVLGKTVHNFNNCFLFVGAN